MLLLRMFLFVTDYSERECDLLSALFLLVVPVSGIITKTCSDCSSMSVACQANSAVFFCTEGSCNSLCSVHLTRQYDVNE